MKINKEEMCPEACLTIQRIALAAKNNQWKCPVLNCSFQPKLTVEDKNQSFRLHIAKVFFNSDHENY